MPPREPALGDELDRLIQLLARLPGLGPRSGRRVALHLLKRRDTLLRPLAAALTNVAERVTECALCGNLDVRQPCALCANEARDSTILCVVEDVGDLWALERTGAFRGRYHVLGGVMSALDGIGPQDLRVPQLLARASAPDVAEVILALGATVEGQTTAHYLAERLANLAVSITYLAHGVPVGGELDTLDDGTLMAALKARRSV